MTHRSLLLYLSFILFTTISHQIKATAAPAIQRVSPQPAQNALQIFLQETRLYRNLMAQTQDAHIKSCTIPLAVLHRVEAEANCRICHEEFAVHPEDQTKTLITLSNAQNEARCCSHMFHTACLMNWFESQQAHGNNLSCPICRSTVSFRQPFHNYRITEDEPAGIVTADREVLQAAVTPIVNQISDNVRKILLDIGAGFLIHYGISLSLIMMHESLNQYVHLSFPSSLIGGGIGALPNTRQSLQNIKAILHRLQVQALRRNFSMLSIGQAATSAFAQRIVKRAQQGAGLVRDAGVTAAQGLYNVTQRGLGALSTQVQQGAQSLWGRMSNGVGSVFRRFAPAENSVQTVTVTHQNPVLNLHNTPSELAHNSSLDDID